jgi:hypothetical protein
MIENVIDNKLYADICSLIENSRSRVVSYANGALVMLFWEIGRRINEHILQNKRADYGKNVVSTLSEQLQNRFGRNFEEKNLRRMLQFAEQFMDKQIVVPLARQLTWSHFMR